MKTELINYLVARLHAPKRRSEKPSWVRRATIACWLAFQVVAIRPAAFAADAHLAVTSFPSFLPTTIAPLAAPTNIAYSLQNFGPGSLGNAFGGTGPVLVDLWLSANTSFGDGDDRHLGQRQFSISAPASSSGTYAHSNPNGLSGFTIPVNAAGPYHVFIRVVPAASSGLTDPDWSNNFNLLPSTITVSAGGDVMPPVVTSIIRWNPPFQTNNLQFLTWLVSFSEPVISVDLGDFTLTDVSGTVIGEFLGNVSAGSGSQVQVTANTGSAGAGGLRLDVNYPGATITDLSGNPLTNSFASGQVYTVDKVAPTVVSIARMVPAEPITSVTSIVWRVTFSEPVQGIGIEDFTLTDVLDTIQSEGLARVSAASGAVIDVTANTGSGEGELRLDVVASEANVRDIATNPLLASFTAGETYLIRRSEPPFPSNDAPAIDVLWETTITARKHNSATTGWEFQVLSPIKVTSLGVFDAGQDGFQQSHRVGIWTTNGALLVQTTIASGAGSPLQNGFRYQAVPETVLRPGHYIIGAFFVHAGPDEILQDPANSTTAPPISFVQPRFGAGDAFAFPDVGQGGTSRNHFGPNFLFGTEILAPTWNSVAIPELPPASELRAVWARTWDEAYVWAARFEASVPHAHLFRWDGATWREALGLTNHAPGRIFGTGDADVFVSTDFYPSGLSGGSSARIYRSTDKGSTWTLQTLPGQIVGSELGFGYFGGTANNVHVHIGAGHVLRFDGVTWESIFSETGRGIYGLTLVAENEGYYVTCGDWGSWDGESWTYRGPASVGCDAYGGVWGMRDAAGLSLYAVGQNNFNNGVRVWGFDEANQRWGQVFADGFAGRGTGNGIGVWGSARDDVYVVGERINGLARSGRVYRFNGVAWAQVAGVGNISTPGGIAGTGRDDIWISLRHEGRMLHYAPASLPALSVAAVATELFVTWPRAVNGYRLETTTSLSSAISWSVVTNPPSLVSDLYQVTLPMTNSTQFYRLAR